MAETKADLSDVTKKNAAGYESSIVIDFPVRTNFISGSNQGVSFCLKWLEKLGEGS